MQSKDHGTKLREVFENALLQAQKITGRQMNKSRSEFLALSVFGLLCARNVQQHQIASHIEGVAEEESKVRRLQHFLANYELDYELVMALVLLLLPSKSKVTLSMDRTEWEFGGQNHNVLVISIYTHGVGFPIWFECLDNNGGNSACDDRIYVLSCCMKMVGVKRIKVLVCDSEFIGEEWIGFLLEEQIPFCIDVRTNQYFVYEGRRQQVCSYMHGRKKKCLDNVFIFGRWLSIAMKKKGDRTNKKKTLAIVTNLKAKDALNHYRNRWSIEVLFQNMKKRGFNLEDTHMKSPKRLRKLFALCTLAFVFAFLTGLKADGFKKVPLKSHGYKAKSFFRYGIDIIKKIFKKGQKKTDLVKTRRKVEYICEKILTIIHDNFLQLQKIVV